MVVKFSNFLEVAIELLKLGIQEYLGLSIPRDLIGQNRDLRKAVFPTFKGLCLPDKTEFGRFSGMYELV